MSKVWRLAVVKYHYEIEKLVIIQVSKSSTSFSCAGEFCDLDMNKLEAECFCSY